MLTVGCSLESESALNTMGSELAQMLLVEVEYAHKHLRSGDRVCNKEPVFIIGMPHTGSTYLQSLLNCDPKIRTFHEYQPFAPTLDFGRTLTGRALRAAKRMKPANSHASEVLNLKDDFLNNTVECLWVMNHALYPDVIQTAEDMLDSSRSALLDFSQRPEVRRRIYAYLYISSYVRSTDEQSE